MERIWLFQKCRVSHWLLLLLLRSCWCFPNIGALGLRESWIDRICGFWWAAESVWQHAGEPWPATGAPQEAVMDQGVPEDSTCCTASQRVCFRGLLQRECCKREVHSGQKHQGQGCLCKPLQIRLCEIFLEQLPCTQGMTWRAKHRAGSRVTVVSSCI